MQQILIIGTVWIEPNASAAGSRMMQLITLFLKNNYKITFVSSAKKGKNAVDLSALGIDEFSVTINSPSFDVFIKNLQPNIVVFDRFMTEEQFGWRVAENCPNALRILDTEDLHSLRKTRHEQLKKGLLFSTNNLLTSDIAKREIAAILRSDLSLIISSFEMKLLKKVFKIDKKLLLHLPFLLETIDNKKTQSWLPFDERANFIFVGTYIHKPNIDAVLQLKTMWQSIKKQLPKAEIHIYGAYPTQQINELHDEKNGFLAKGFVKNIENLVKKARIVIAPIRFGAGIKGKLTEAMLCGTPSITTHIGAEGMHDKLPWNGVVCAINDFSKQAVQLYTNKQLWETAQQNGIAIINTLYNKDVLGKKLIKRIQKTQQNLTKHRKKNFMGNLLQHQTMYATKYMSKWIEAKNKE